MSCRKPANLVLIVALGLIGAVGATRVGRDSPTNGRPSTVASASPADSAAKIGRAGALSCSGRGCHGAVDATSGPKSREFLIWRQADRHADAFDALFSERARSIQKLRRRKVAADQDADCLVCHPGPGRNRTIDDRFPAIGGVDCESCHGASEHWLSSHSRPEWKSKSLAEKASLGLIDLSTPKARVGACLACHVGDESGEVDHDLIAAGHPRLNFEAAAYAAEMPRHWTEKSNPSDADLWKTGQIETAKAALRLLIARAERAKAGGKRPTGIRVKTVAPWPEFAEYDCFACHHDLKPNGHARRFGFISVFGKRRPGAFPWGSWYYSIPRVLADESAGRSLDELAALMGEPRPDPAATIVSARSSLQAVESIGRASAIERLASRAKLKLLSEANWDSAAQLYLALSALRPDDRPTLEKLSRELRFPPRQDGPGDFRADDPIEERPWKPDE